MDCPNKFSDRVRQILSSLAQDSTVFSGLEDQYEAFVQYVSLIPDVAKTVSISAVTQEAFGSDVKKGVSQLFHQAESMMKLYWHVLACNLVTLVSMAISSLNKNEYMPSSLATRALVEHTAVASFRLRKLDDLNRKIGEFRPSDVRRGLRTRDGCNRIFEAVIPVIVELDLCFGAGRFNRSVLDDLADLSIPIDLPREHPRRQIGVMDAIDQLDWTGPLVQATTPRFYYEMLCDYVHPNGSANIIYVDRQLVSDISLPGASAAAGSIERHTTLHPTDESIGRHVMQLLLIPLRESLRLGKVQLERLGSEIEKRGDFCRSLREMNFLPHIR